MKVIAIFFIAFVIFVAADDGPTKISDNNMGDIVNVGVKAKAKIDNKIDTTIIQILLKYLNDQQIRIGGSGNGGGNIPTLPPNLPTLPPNLPTLPPNFPPIEFPPIPQ